MVFKSIRQGEQSKKDEFEQIAESEPVDGLFLHKHRERLPKTEDVHYEVGKIFLPTGKGGHQHL